MARRVLFAAAVVLLGVCQLAVAGAAPSAAGHHSKSSLSRLGIRHVFVIVLENESYHSTYVNNPHHYLGRKLQRQGTLLTKYYATGHESNDNYLSMISGQAPNVATQSDCQLYVDFKPAPARLNADGQAVGQGCVFPANVPTLANQLEAKHLSWRGYMEDMGNDLTREPSRCGEPTASFGSGMPDGTQSADANDQYAARHNPFVYFHSLIDTGSCHRNVVPLTHLRRDLKHHSTTPRFSFITPNLCNDGHDAPCVGKDSKDKRAGGLSAVDHFLKLWVPRIKASPGFHRHGLLVITSDESDTGDTTSCCGEKPGPNSPSPGAVGAGGTGPGGGRIGALLLGRCVKRGAKDHHPYNHYSFLRSMEDLYGITHGGTDGNGHIGFAGAKGLKSFGPDAFRGCHKRHRGSPVTHAPSNGPPTGTSSNPSTPVTQSGAVLPTTGDLPMAGIAAALVALALLLARTLTVDRRRP